MARPDHTGAMRSKRAKASDSTNWSTTGLKAGMPARTARRRFHGPGAAFSRASVLATIAAASPGVRAGKRPTATVGRCDAPRQP